MKSPVLTCPPCPVRDPYCRCPIQNAEIIFPLEEKEVKRRNRKDKHKVKRKKWVN